MGLFGDITSALSIANPLTAGSTLGLGNLFSSSGGAAAALPVAGAVGGSFFGQPALGASLGAGIAGMLSAQQQNQAAKDAALQAEQFSAGQVSQQEAFQQQMLSQQEGFETQMSDTSVQRMVADMKAAGINPMLAAGAGESTPSIGLPSGASASGVQAPVVPEVGAGVSSALDTLNLLQNLKESNSRVLKNVQDTELSSMKGAVATQTANLMSKQNDILGAEASIVKAHPSLTGWAKVLADRGIGIGSLGNALSLFAE